MSWSEALAHAGAAFVGYYFAAHFVVAWWTGAL